MCDSAIDVGYKYIRKIVPVAHKGCLDTARQLHTTSIQNLLKEEMWTMRV